MKRRESMEIFITCGRDLIKLQLSGGDTSYILEEMEGGLVSGGPINQRLLGHYFL